MTNSMRIKIALLATAVFVGGLSIAGLAVRHHGPAGTTPAKAQAQTQGAPAVSTFEDGEQELDED
jgi:hypothetical protein